MKKAKLSMEIVKKAAKGDPAAQEKLLEYYDPYIRRLCRVEIETKDGEIRYFTDEDKRMELQMTLIKVTTNWEPKYRDDSSSFMSQ